MRTLLYALVGLGLAVSCVSEGDENTPATGGTTSGGGAPSGGADASGGGGAAGAAESGRAPPTGTAGGPDGEGGANAGGDTNAGGQFADGGQAGAGGDPVPSDLLLYKLVEPGNSFDVVVGYEPLPDMQGKATELGADGYVITTAVWDTDGSPFNLRYFAFTR